MINEGITMQSIQYNYSEVQEMVIFGEYMHGTEPRVGFMLKSEAEPGIYQSTQQLSGVRFFPLGQGWQSGFEVLTLAEGESVLVFGAYYPNYDDQMFIAHVVQSESTPTDLLSDVLDRLNASFPGWDTAENVGVLIDQQAIQNKDQFLVNLILEIKTRI